MSKLYPLEKAIEVALRTASEARADGRSELAQLYESYAAVTRRAMSASQPHNEFVSEVLAATMCMLSWHTVAMRERSRPPEELVVHHVELILQAFGNGLMAACGIHGHVTTDTVAEKGMVQ